MASLFLSGDALLFCGSCASPRFDYGGAFAIHERCCCDAPGEGIFNCIGESPMLALPDYRVRQKTGIFENGPTQTTGMVDICDGDPCGDCEQQSWVDNNGQAGAAGILLEHFEDSIEDPRPTCRFFQTSGHVFNCNPISGMESGIVTMAVYRFSDHSEAEIASWSSTASYYCDDFDGHATSASPNIFTLVPGTNGPTDAPSELEVFEDGT